jgi:hypothetical protein
LSSEVVMTMATMASTATVIAFEPHHARRSAIRRSPEFLAAMRRHPSYQGQRLEAVDDRENAVVIRFRRR